MPRRAGSAGDTTARTTWLCAVLVAALYAFTGLWTDPLDATDEIRVAEIAREMSVSRDLVLPRLGGVPFVEHPPLFYAAAAGAFRLLGVSDAVARMPSALATLALLLLVFDLGRRTDGARAGALAAAVLACMSGVWRYGHDCMVDASLALFVGAGYWAYARLLLAEADVAPEARPHPPAAAGRRRPSPPLLLGVYVFAALAFLVKGPVGPALLALPVLAHALLTRRRALLLSPVHLLGLPLLLAGCALWPALLYPREGHQPFGQWWRADVLGRILPDEDYAGGHVRGPFFYLTAFPGLAMPWIVALPFVVRWLVARRATEGDAQTIARRRVHGFLATACAVGLALLSAAGTKRGLYALPLLAPLALLTGAWMVSVGPRARRNLERSTAIAFVLSLLALLYSNVDAHPERDLSPLATDLASMGVLPDTLGFQLSERVRAIVPFRTGVILPDVRQAPELDELLARRGDCRLLIEGTVFGQIAPATAGSLRPLRSWSFGRREVVLYAPASATAHADSVVGER